LFNSFFGYQAGNATTGTYNTANGYQALLSNTTGSINTAIGVNALKDNIGGGTNTAIGVDALQKNNGNSNTAIGYSALNLNINGSENTATGVGALNKNTAGYNTAMGFRTLYDNTTGIINSAFGYLANVSTGNLTNATAIGANAMVGASNSMVLGSINGVNGATTDVNVGIGTTTPSTKLHISSTTSPALRLVDGTQASNKVLTSDANGNASWQALPAGVSSFSAGTTGFTPNVATTGAVTLAGTLNVANGGTGQTSYTDGQLLIGNSAGNTLTKSTLTAGSGISITNAGGSITIANSSPSSGGTVTSVAALTLGTTGTDLSSTVATGTTTPVITLNVPTASASNRGVLSTGDWTSFNSKESALTFSTGLTRTTNTITVNTSQNINTLSNLTSNGLIKTSGGTGALSIATAGTDYLTPTGSAASLTSFPTFNQNTTGSAATLTTPRNIYGNSFNGSADLNQVIASTYGGTGNGFTKFTGPTTSEKTFTLPDANTTLVGTDLTQTLTNKTLTNNTNDVTARALWSGSGAGSVSTYAATAPTTGQVLTATSATTATWQTPTVPAVHTIGESYGGGIVFYVYDNGQHGLIAATVDQSTSMRWYGGTNTNTRARANGVGAGLKNTAIIIANQGPVDGNEFAATVANEYSVTVGGVTYGDWYLPSLYELSLMYSYIGQGAPAPNTNVGGFASDVYWSSTEVAINTALQWGFNLGVPNIANKTQTRYVRAVRAF
jgi:hypothetical protein